MFPFIQGIAIFAIFWIALFLPAGTIKWGFGWLFWGSFFVFFMGTTAWLTINNPGLAQERTKLSSRDQKGWDKILFWVMLVVPLIWLVVMALDACRFHWTYVPRWLHMIGLLLLVASFAILAVVFQENSFLSPVVRLQTDRKQHVISTGPYALVRHPMYSALIPFFFGTSFLLGSWVGVVLAFLYLLVLARRAILEEQMLNKELGGYREYMAKVRFRMIPGIW